MTADMDTLEQSVKLNLIGRKQVQARVSHLMMVMSISGSVYLGSEPLPSALLHDMNQCNSLSFTPNLTPFYSIKNCILCL